MSKTITQPSGLQQNSVNPPGRSFTMIEDSIDNSPLKSHEKDRYRRLVRIIRRCGGICDWSRRRLAAALDISIETLKRLFARLRLFGKLCVQYRRISGVLNDTNVYTLPGGGGVINDPEKLKAKELKTTTPPQARREDNHNPAMRKLYELNGVLHGQLRSLRAILKGRTYQRSRIDTDNLVCVAMEPSGPPPELSVADLEIRAKMLQQIQERNR
jgi:hypothetical protein